MAIEGRRIMVTGGAGFIGSHIVEALVHHGADVTVVDHMKGPREKNLANVRDRIRLIRMDIRQPEFAALVIDSPFHVIFHFASPASVSRSVEAPYVDFEQGLHSTVQLLELLRESCPNTVLITASAAAVYGNPVKLPMEESDPTFPISPYGVSKLSIERYVSVYSQLYGIRAASLRFFSLYGPGQRQLVVYDLIAKLVNDPDNLMLLGDGTETRDLIYIDDAVRAVLAVYEHGALDGEVYNIASGKSHAIMDVARAVASALNADPKFTFTERRTGDPITWRAEIEEIGRLGFQPRVALQDGISQTVAWYRETVAGKRV